MTKNLLLRLLHYILNESYTNQQETTPLNLAFYTYFYGSNDNPAYKIPELPSTKYKCYYFTNNNSIFEKSKDTDWIGVYDNKPTNDDLIESNMVGKRLKAMPEEYIELQNYDYLCFLDSKLGKVNEDFVENMIDTYFINQDYALLLRKHNFINDNVWNEYNESMKQERYIMEKEKYKKYIQKQLDTGLSVDTDKHCQCNLLIRNMKHSKIIDIDNMWYQHIQECGIQDQISFFFIKQIFNEYILPFTENPFV
jgi:hypothetical protein